MLKDETPPSLSKLSWKPEDVEASLETLYGYVEAEAVRQINWYYRKKKLKAFMSRNLRLAAILLTGAGGLIPIIGAFFNTDQKPGPLPIPLGQLGYVLLALAGGLVLFDRYFGFSTGWMRYITAALKLERSLGEFRLEWARLNAQRTGNPPTPEQAEELIQLCCRFSSYVRTQVEQETYDWVREFNSNLSQLEGKARKPESRSEGGQPAPPPEGEAGTNLPVTVDWRMVEYREKPRGSDRE